MKAKKAFLLLILLWVGLALMAGPALSAPFYPERDKREQRYSPDDYKRRGYVQDKRYQHNRYYPRPGAIVRALPPKHRVVRYHNRPYFFSDGFWLVASGSGFRVTLPPVGLRVSFLPSHYTRIWVAGLPYYYAAGAYYRWYPEQRVYQVVKQPVEQEVKNDTQVPEQLFIYPKNSQSAAQQASDRYQCHSWARSETGFDPTQPAGGVSNGENEAKRADYNRAMKACLEARDYSVQ